MDNSLFVKSLVLSASKYPNEVFTHKCQIYTCVNPYSYHMVRKNMDLFMSMDGLFVDGITMCTWVRFLWRKKIPRLSFDMTGIAKDLLTRLNMSEETIFFIGARQDQIEKTIQNIQSTYPYVHIVGYRNGYFSSDEEREQEILKITKLNPDFLVCGLGSPLQEIFAVDLKKSGYKGIVFTCGGFLHQSAAKMNYYPDWIDKYNLRAFYRLYKEKGLFKRLYNVLIEFPILFICDSVQAYKNV